MTTRSSQLTVQELVIILRCDLKLEIFQLLATTTLLQLLQKAVPSSTALPFVSLLNPKISTQYYLHQLLQTFGRALEWLLHQLYYSHYITQEWDLESIALSISFLPDDHTAAVISDALEETLKEWELSPLKQVCLTTDSCANMVAAARNYLKKYLSRYYLSNTSQPVPSTNWKN